MQVVPASIASFLVACTMLLALRPLAQVIGLIDKPGGRKTHRGEVPVVGGLAMFAGLLAAAPALAGQGSDGVVIVVGALFMVFLGALDDRFDLPPGVRLFAHLSAAVALVYGIGLVVGSLGDLVGLGTLDLGWSALPFTVVAIVALINAFNMLDGLDGLAGGAGLVASAGIVVLATLGGVTDVALLAADLVGAIAAFLAFNLPMKFNRPVRTFMGDAGSTLLGFVLASLSLKLVQPGTMSLPSVVVLWLMPIPIFELFASTTRRIVHGMSPARADTGHFHHVLIRSGFSVRAVCTVYILVSAASCITGVWAFKSGVSEPVLFAGFCLGFGSWLLFVRYARKFIVFLPDWFKRIDPATD
jgi:UDP-GlcNAc:undecaprenyl-phosphate GlcNAc-1-phosphate transferase